MVDITPLAFLGCSSLSFVVVGKGVGAGGKKRGRTRKECLTSATGAKRAIAVATRGACSDDFSVNVLGVVRVDVTGATTAVGYFGSCHCGCWSLGVGDRYAIDGRRCEGRKVFRRYIQSLYSPSSICDRWFTGSAVRRVTRKINESDNAVF